jgi:ketosteroid isomerase-like protein
LFKGGKEMKKWFVFCLVVVMMVLAACNKEEETASQHGSVNDGESVNGHGAIDHGVDDKKVGFNVTGDTIEEAANVPAEEKERILEVFDVYIDAFNNKNIERYMNTLSEHSESFDLGEERSYLEEQFNEFDIKLQASDVTIVKYDEQEAQIFMNLKTSMKQLSTGLETNPSGRQVIVLTKDDGEWKVASVHRIGDNPQK